MTHVVSNRKFKHLGSPDRVGRHARRIVVDTVKDFVVSNVFLLLGLALLPGAAVFITTGFTNQSERVRWLYLGAAAVSGPWLVTILVIIWTGIGNPLMGLEGENRTAEILRKFRVGGWQVVNGMKLIGDWDIDHVLVGPFGVLVIESKWSHETWPADQRGKGFMSGRLRDSVSQVLKNCDQFKSVFKKDLVGVTITSVCVLWSHDYETYEPFIFQPSGVIIIPGLALEKWLASLTANWLDSNRVENLSTVLDLQATIRDKKDSGKFNSPLPTFSTLVIRNIFTPALGFALASAGFVFTARSESLRIIGFVFAGSTAVGVFLAKNLSLRRIAQGWIFACFVQFCVLVIALIQSFTR